MTLLAPTLQAWFTERLMTQRQASPHTIAGYRDTMRLLLRFASTQTGKPPSKLEIDDLDAELITRFLVHLEQERGNSARTRNARLAAIHSLYRYAAFRHPEHAAVIERVLAIPTKRFDRALVNYLTKDEARALIAAPDSDTWTGRRDHALLLVAVQTGLRVSELTGLTCKDVQLGTGAHLYCHGKRRKQRVVPLTSQTVKALKRWLKERGGEPNDPLFPSNRGGPLSRDAVEWMINKHTTTAAAGCPSLKTKRVTAHVLLKDVLVPEIGKITGRLAGSLEVEHRRAAASELRDVGFARRQSLEKRGTIGASAQSGLAEHELAALHAALADDDSAVLRAAIVAVGDFGDSTSVPALLNNLGADDEGSGSRRSTLSATSAGARASTRWPASRAITVRTTT